MPQPCAHETLLLPPSWTWASSFSSPTWLSSAHVLPSQVVANLSGCGQVDSETLVGCLRAKSEEEMLEISKVGPVHWDKRVIGSVALQSPWATSSGPCLPAHIALNVHG